MLWGSLSQSYGPYQGGIHTRLTYGQTTVHTYRFSTPINDCNFQLFWTIQTPHSPDGKPNPGPPFLRGFMKCYCEVWTELHVCASNISYYRGPRNTSVNASPSQFQLMTRRFNDYVAIDNLHHPTKNLLMSRQLQSHLPWVPYARNTISDPKQSALMPPGIAWGRDDLDTQAVDAENTSDKSNRAPIHLTI